MSGTLFIVATPIGNLEDITLRALRVLKEADVIAAEDTRVSRKLLSHFDIHTRLISYNQHSNGKRAESILDLLKEGKSVALISDAGTPGISDPGFELVAMCIAENINITSIPGASAFIQALVVSGLSTTHFAFDGFPPRKTSEQIAFFESLKNDMRTLIFYEAPLRLLKTLKSMHKVYGDRQIVIMREATKMFEEIFRGTISESMEHFAGSKVRGEIVIVLEGSNGEETATSFEEMEINMDTRLAFLIDSGMTERDAVRRCMIEFKLPKRLVYAASLKLKALRESSALDQ